MDNTASTAATKTPPAQPGAQAAASAAPAAPARATWMKGQPSPYEGHDITKFPDWKNIIVWDAFCNNLTAGFMIFICLTVLFGQPVFAVLMPFALLVAFAVLVIDLLLLIADLGDPWRFSHSLRLFRPTSPLSVGVWGLSAYATFLAFAIVFLGATLFLPLPPPWLIYLNLFTRLFITLAAIGAIVVICYKGVVFSCTSQPGVKDARWLTAFMVSDSLLMGCGLYILVALAVGVLFDVWRPGVPTPGAARLAVPFVALACIRCVAVWLLWLDVAPRARRVYPADGRGGLFIASWLAGGLVAVVAAFCGPLGLACAGALVLVTGLYERYWIIGLARPL